MCLITDKSRSRSYNLNKFPQHAFDFFVVVQNDGDTAEDVVLTFF